MVFWVASLGTLGAVLMASSVVGFVTGLVGVKPEQILANVGVSVVFFALQVANMWINLVLGVKRLHDRDRTGWWIVLPSVLILLSIFAWALGEAPGRPGALPVVLGLTALIAMGWLFIELGFLRGTQGPNQFGPDPLGAVQPDAKL